jgi:SAM-dependent methyltransferase
VTESTAGVDGPEWSAKAEVWAELWAHLAAPARAVLAGATAIGPGTRVLDVGCGSGELCALAAERGAVVAGIDAAEGMIAIARRRLPDAELRVRLGREAREPAASAVPGAFTSICEVKAPCGTARDRRPRGRPARLPSRS